MARTLSAVSRMRPRAVAAVAVLIGAAVFASSAHAGRGDVVEQAQGKTAQVAVQEATTKAEGAGAADAAGGKVEFTDVILELTSERLDHFLMGLKSGGGDAAERSALVARKTELINQADALTRKYGATIGASRRRRSDAQHCWKDALSAARERNDLAMQRNMVSDPALRGRMLELSKRLGQAQANGDTATLVQLQREMMSMTGPTHADTLTANQKCGSLPALHFAAGQIDSLQRLAAETGEQIRDMDRQSAAARVKASGMDAAQFATARERIEKYLAAIKAKSTPRAFTPAELTALAAHQHALEAALE